jgi:hypothetical protein
MSTTTLRCRRIRFKNGHTIEVLRPRIDDVAGRLRSHVQAITSDGIPLVGFAVVAWRADGTVMPSYYNGPRSPILAGQVPQYAKDCLLTECAARWSKD